MLTKKEIVELSKKHSFFLKKRLGQNFLTDKNMVEKMLNSMEIGPEDVILEVGPGLGALTGGLTERCRKVYAVEKDKKLCELMKDLYADSPTLIIVNEDILDFDIAAIAEERVTLVGALPYYITSPIIERIVGWRDRVRLAYITIQKEVAGRITAGVGEEGYSSFSLFVQYYAEVLKVLDLKRSVFFPIPEVDSALLSIRILDKPRITVKDEGMLFRVIRQAFGQRRKKLSSSLSHKEAFGVSKEELTRIILAVGIDPSARAEALTLEAFGRIADGLVDFSL